MVDVTLLRVKGSPLTYEEGDNNFEGLANAINQLEATANDSVLAHVAAPNPHPQYTNDSEAETIANAAVAAHVALSNPHSQYATDDDLDNVVDEFNGQVVKYAETNAAAVTLSASLGDGATVITDNDEAATPAGAQTRRVVTGGVLGAPVNVLDAGQVNTSSNQTIETRLKPFNTDKSLGSSSSTTTGVNDNIIAGGYGTFTPTLTYSRPAWDALGPDPVLQDTKLALTGVQFSTAVNSAVLIGGRSDYYSAIGPTASLSLTYNGDNINEHLAGINLGFHTDLIKGLALDGVTLKGSHGGIFGGSFQQVAGDYSWVGGGQVNQCFALQSAILSGKNNKIGSLANVDAVRRSGIFSGAANNIVAGFENAIVGGFTNVITSGDRSAIIAGQGNSITAIRGITLAARDSSVTAEGAAAHGRGVKANISNALTKSSGSFSVQGDSQTHHVECRRTTTGPSFGLSVSGGSGVDIFVPEANTTGVGVFEVIVHQAGISTDWGAAFIVKFAYSNVGGTLAIKGQTTETIYENDAAFNCVAAIAGAGTRIGITVTTPDANTYRSSATGRLVVNRI